MIFKKLHQFVQNFPFVCFAIRSAFCKMFLPISEIADKHEHLLGKVVSVLYTFATSASARLNTMRAFMHHVSWATRPVLGGGTCVVGDAPCLGR